MHRFLRDCRFYETCLEIDRAVAGKVYGKACPYCDVGVLHAAHYNRSPRGCPPGLPEGFGRRFSFCCSKCRQRVTPPSVRFLGRRWYVAPAVVVLSALMHRALKPPLEQIRGWVRERLSRRTLARWRRWWLDFFPRTETWRGGRGRFARPVAESRLPQSLVDAFGRELRASLESALRFLGPLTTASCAGCLTGPKRR